MALFNREDPITDEMLAEMLSGLELAGSPELPEEVPPEARDRLLRAQACLRLLKQARPPAEP